jgi:hypothetical protein
LIFLTPELLMLEVPVCGKVTVPKPNQQSRQSSPQASGHWHTPVVRGGSAPIIQGIRERRNARATAVSGSTYLAGRIKGV